MTVDSNIDVAGKNLPQNDKSFSKAFFKSRIFCFLCSASIVLVITSIIKNFDAEVNIIKNLINFCNQMLITSCHFLDNIAKKNWEYFYIASCTIIIYEICQWCKNGISLLEKILIFSLFFVIITSLFNVLGGASFYDILIVILALFLMSIIGVVFCLILNFVMCHEYGVIAWLLCFIIFVVIPISYLMISPLQKSLGFSD